MVLERTESSIISTIPRIQTERDIYIDFILRDISEQKNLSETKHELAKERYGAVAKWLDNAPDDDPLSQIKIKIYPIGSFLCNTTVKPMANDEFDVDMAGELQLNYQDYPEPRAAVDIFEKRIRKNKTYNEIAIRKTRVIRLNYAGDFHLDFMPCFPTNLQNKECTNIKIPHKVTDALYIYKDSNPLGLNEWFEKKSNLNNYIIKLSKHERIDNEIAPFPGHKNKKKSPLKLSLQLVKHMRNFYFAEDNEGKKDISTVILKVLIASSYTGEQNIYFILRDFIRRLYAEFYPISSPVILNPINSSEDFAEKWRSDPERVAFKKFKGFIYSMNELITELESSKESLPQIASILKKFLGTTEVNLAIDKIGHSLNESTKTGKVFVTSTGLITTTKATGTTMIKDHKFYGHK